MFEYLQIAVKKSEFYLYFGNNILKVEKKKKAPVYIFLFSLIYGRLFKSHKRIG